MEIEIIRIVGILYKAAQVILEELEKTTHEICSQVVTLKVQAVVDN